MKRFKKTFTGCSSIQNVLNETIDSRRYEWSVSGMNEQILVKIRSGATLLHKLFFTDLTGGKNLIILSL